MDTLELKNDSKNFVQDIMTRYFTELEPAILRDVLHPQITWFGSGLDEVSHNLEEAHFFLDAFSDFRGATYTLLESWFDSSVLNETDVIVYGEMRTQKNISATQTIEILIRMSIVCRWENERFWIFHLNISTPLITTKQSSEKTEKNSGVIHASRNQLKEKLQELTNLTNGIMGGIEIFALDEGFTIQYLSHGFVEMLGYTAEETQSFIGKQHKDLIFPPDYDLVTQSFDEQLQEKNSYEVEYRMTHKDGHLIWALEKGNVFFDQGGEKRLQCIVIDISEQKRQQEALRISESRYEIAMEASELSMFEYKVENRSLTFFGDYAKKYGIPEVIENGPETLVSSGMISEVSATMFKNMFRQINAGAPLVQSYVIGRDEKGELNNYEIKLTTIYSDMGVAIGAIGVMKDVDEIVQMQKESEFARGLMESKSVVITEYNLTENKIIKDPGGWSEKTPYFTSDLYTETHNFFLENLVHQDDKASFYEFLNRDTLLESVKEGDAQITLQYRRCREDNDYKWWSLIVHMHEDPQTHHAHAIFYEENIDLQKQKEISLRYDAEHDKMSGLYNKISTEAYIKNFLLQSETQKGLHALLIIDLDFFKQVNDSFGHLYGDKVLVEVSSEIRNVFRNTDIIGRIGGDEFCVLMKNVISYAEVTEKAKKVCAQLCKTYTVDGISVSISGSVGVAFTDKHGFDYKNLFTRADEALYESKNAGRNRVTF